MERVKIANEYTKEFLETDRPQPLSDHVFERLQLEVLEGKMNTDVSDSIYRKFIDLTQSHIMGSKLNMLRGLESYPEKDIIIGCTQFIDDLYMQGPIQVLADDYKYHQRLGLAQIRSVGNLLPRMALIISVPFPRYGKIHPQMGEILAEASDKNIPIHVDGAWITCSRNIDFDLDHPCIKSIGISLSKGLGLGWNRVGVRWRRTVYDDSISIMNKFNMSNKTLIKVGIHYLENIEPDYLWNTYGDRYRKVCRDFDLEETDSIHIAMRDAQPVGLSPLLRYL